jgi:hypothetical protein
LIAALFFLFQFVHLQVSELPDRTTKNKQRSSNSNSQQNSSGTKEQVEDFIEPFRVQLLPPTYKESKARQALSSSVLESRKTLLPGYFASYTQQVARSVRQVLLTVSKK